MKENVGKKDRIMRSVLGPALMVAGYTSLRGCEGKAGGLATMIFGALVIESAVTRVCPLNAAFGIDSREDKPLNEVRGKIKNKPKVLY